MSHSHFLPSASSSIVILRSARRSRSLEMAGRAGSKDVGVGVQCGILGQSSLPVDIFFSVSELLLLFPCALLWFLCLLISLELSVSAPSFISVAHCHSSSLSLSLSLFYLRYNLSLRLSELLSLSCSPSLKSHRAVVLRDHVTFRANRL